MLRSPSQKLTEPYAASWQSGSDWVGRISGGPSAISCLWPSPTLPHGNQGPTGLGEFLGAHPPSPASDGAYSASKGVPSHANEDQFGGPICHRQIGILASRTFTAMFGRESLYPLRYGGRQICAVRAPLIHARTDLNRSKLSHTWH